MRISDWSSDVCSSDLSTLQEAYAFERCQSAYDRGRVAGHHPRRRSSHRAVERDFRNEGMSCDGMLFATMNDELEAACAIDLCILRGDTLGCAIDDDVGLSKKIVQSAGNGDASLRSEEHTSELQSLMRISYAVFCLNNKEQVRKND